MSGEDTVHLAGPAMLPLVRAAARLAADRPGGVKVHVDILPGDPLEYVQAMRRAHLLPGYPRQAEPSPDVTS